MKNVAVGALLAGAGSLFFLSSGASGLPPELSSALPVASLAGKATMSMWGFGLYQASLWVAPGFSEAAYERTAFVLDLTYLRNFRGPDIAQRSIREMRRQGPLKAEDEARWEAQMRALFPDVTPGDRLTGIHQPGVGVIFWSNGRLLGEIRDPEFSRLFFGIWLSPQTSELLMRQALVAGAKALPHAGTPP